LPAETERNGAMKSQKKSPYRLFLGIFLISIFVACQAGQPKAQKQAVTKQTATVTVKTDTAKTDTGKIPVRLNGKIIVYYFHGNARCPTCHALENYAKHAFETNFAKAIKKGELEWKTVNVETVGNEHFNDDYKLYTKSVIVSTLKDGKEVSWKNLDQIWTIIRDETKYKDYITREVKACLEGKCL
jgi:hypothetical protein